MITSTPPDGTRTAAPVRLQVEPAPYQPIYDELTVTAGQQSPLAGLRWLPEEPSIPIQYSVSGFSPAGGPEMIFEYNTHEAFLAEPPPAPEAWTYTVTATQPCRTVRLSGLPWH